MRFLCRDVGRILRFKVGWATRQGWADTTPPKSFGVTITAQYDGYGCQKDMVQNSGQMGTRDSPLATHHNHPTHKNKYHTNENESMSLSKRFLSVFPFGIKICPHSFV